MVKLNTSFYVLSNSSTNSYPNNTLTNFRNKLPKPFNISNKKNVKIALERIGFSPNFRNLELPDKDFPNFVICVCKDQTKKTNLLSKIEGGGCKYASFDFEDNDEHTYFKYRFEDKKYNLRELKTFFTKVSLESQTSFTINGNKLEIKCLDDKKSFWLFLHPMTVNSLNIFSLRKNFFSAKVPNLKKENADEPPINNVGNQLNIPEDEISSAGGGGLFGNKKSENFFHDSIQLGDHIQTPSLKERKINVYGQEYFCYQISSSVIPHISCKLRDLEQVNFPKIVKVISDKITPQILNNAYSQDLICFCPDFEKKEKFFSHEFERKTHIPLCNTILDTMQFKLVDENNSQLQLLPGTSTILKLHIKEMDLYKKTFNIRLRSTSENFSDNTNSKFTVKLPTKLMFNRSWNVALTSISHPNIFQTFLHDETVHVYFISSSDSSQILEKCVFTIPNEVYTTKESLLQTMTERASMAFSEISDLGMIQFGLNDKNLVEISFTKHKNDIKLGMSKNLLALLGFKPNAIVDNNSGEEYELLHFTEKEIEEGKLFKIEMLNDNNEDELLYVYPFANDVNLDLFKPDYMILYSDLVAPSMFGEKFINILSNIGVNHNNKNKYVLQEHKTDFYYKVQYSSVEFIKLELRSHDGKPIHFGSKNDVILNLRFFTHSY